MALYFSNFYTFLGLTRILLESILPALILFPFLLLLAKNQTKVKSIIILVLIFWVYQILLKAPTQTQHIQIIHSKWNWTGKIFTITFGTCVYYLIRESLKPFDFIGFKKESIFLKRPLIVASLPILLAFFSYFNPKTEYDFETLLYESTMPGIDEEIMFRAVFLGIMLNALKERFSFLNLSIRNPSLILNGLLFGLVHGLQITKGLDVNFDYRMGLGTFFYGYLYGWLTIQSRSILLGVLSHNFSNVLIHLIPMIK